ncbi:uncharacterized protein [Eurosta solidaginis]|uniref:uncharacterized protein n=1 Tax=Eurosta solidaginis TaxID=178769 RepID=UPI0035309ADD
MARHIFAINKPYPTIQEFSIWLQQISLYIAMATEVNTSKTNKDQLAQKSNRISRPVLTIGEEKQRCQFCNSNHKLYQCTNFKDADYNKRWEVVKKNRLCFSCLSTSHNMQNCPRRRECGVSACRKYHHKLLHNHITATLHAGNTANTEQAVATVSECQKNNHQNNNRKINKQNLQKGKECGTLLKFLPIKLHGPKGSLEVMAFIDDGSKVTLLEERIANRIGLRGASNLLHLKWFDNQTTTEVSKRVEVEVSSAHESTVYVPRSLSKPMKI